MKKIILAFGILFILIISTISPIVFGDNNKRLNKQTMQLITSEDHNLIIKSLSNYTHDDSKIARSADLKSIIWDNGGPIDEWVLMLSQLDEVFPFNAQVADDFIFEDGDTEVQGVRWWGNFWGVGDPVDPLDFNIYFYADDGTGNAPTGGGMEHPESTALTSYFIEDISGINDSGHRFYSADLPIPFLALEGEKYWLVVQAVFEILPKWGRVTNDGTIHLSSSMFGCPLLGDPYWTDLGYGDVAWYLTGGANECPNAPVITGPTNGKIGIKYEYNFSISDPDADSMHIRIDWEYGTPGKWDGPYPSGSILKYNYTWKKFGTYTIRAQTMDNYGELSDWGKLDVNMPRDKIWSNSFFISFFKKYPLLITLLTLIIN